MSHPRSFLICLCAVLTWTGAAIARPEPAEADPHSQQQANPNQSGKDGTTAGVPAVPRGKKLILKDGSYQVVRSYEKNGDRVRYYSVERGAWEEIPTSMVDWDATAKAEAVQKGESDALAKKIHTQEEARNMDNVLDIDASLPIGQGVFLPSGEGMFLIDGKYVMHLEQAGAAIKTDKKTVLKQVLTPIPIVASKHNVEIPGAHATIRIANSNPEFYLREAPSDPDRDSSIQHSSRPGESGPEVELVRATVKGGKRQLESIKSMFGQELGTERKTISVQRWEIAKGVYRFTLSEPLSPGEYALAEILPDGMNLYVWDFGVDGTAPAEKTN